MSAPIIWDCRANLLLSHVTVCLLAAGVMMITAVVLTHRAGQPGTQRTVIAPAASRVFRGLDRSGSPAAASLTHPTGECRLNPVHAPGNVAGHPRSIPGRLGTSEQMQFCTLPGNLIAHAFLRLPRCPTEMSPVRDAPQACQ
jgi:hypothetical protein